MNDASICDVDIKTSRTELDSHANMAVLGKNSHVLSETGKTARVQPYSPNYKPQIIPIVDAAVMYECPYSGKRVGLVIRDALHVKEMENNLIPPFIMREAGIQVKEIPKIHVDNPSVDDHAIVFKETGFRIPLSLHGIQNGIAEAKVKEVCYGGRTILLHAKRKWPDVISTILWPFAVQAVVDRHNRLTLDDNGRSPLEKFTGEKDDIKTEEFRTWGCPVYVLNAPNQSGGVGTPKWEPRSHVGIYLGRSPVHAGNVSLVLNLGTGLVSPQYHLVFDDEFTTVKYLQSSNPPPNWANLIKQNTISAPIDPSDAINEAWLHPSKADTVASEGVIRERADTITTSRQPVAQQHTQPPSVTVPSVSGGIETSNAAKLVPVDPKSADTINLDEIGLRRSQRLRNQKRSPIYTFLTTTAVSVGKAMMASQDSATICFQSRVAGYRAFLDDNFDGSANTRSPLAQAYFSSQANNEVYTLREMLAQPDRDDFIKAMEVEVASMFDEGIWEKIPRREMTDHYNEHRALGKEVQRQQIMMIWSFKRKRHPDGTLKKHKARLCCHGGQQQWGLNYWETYAPVVSWSSIRFLLTLSKLHKMHTKSIDFVQAYPQASIKSTIYLKSPPGVELTRDKEGEMVLRLKRNLYGLKDAGRTWFEHLSEGLLAMGFSPTVSDPCIFTRGHDMIILYVDDCIVISRSEFETNKVYEELKQRGFKTTDEGSLEEYLGLKIEQDANSFRVSQPMLIDRIIASVPRMREAKSAKTPAAAGQILTKDDDGEERQEHWNYRSVVGMLNYLVMCSHPELSFAVHQCARFCNKPMRVHEQAVKRVIRYLIGTKRNKCQGTIYRPDHTKSIEVYVDASFAGDWSKTWKEDESSVMSRTGYVINYANCPVVWASKLQTEIALSTTESEYIAFSQSLRDVIPLLGLLGELRDVVPNDPRTPKMHFKVFEDNRGCIDLVRTPRMRPRTKHIALKYHHFRKHVADGTISVEYFETGRQVTEIFTKALSDVQFGILRMLLMGW